jgi:hypothetical protein
VRGVEDWTTGTPVFDGDRGAHFRAVSIQQRSIPFLRGVHLPMDSVANAIDHGQPKATSLASGKNHCEEEKGTEKTLWHLDLTP